MPDADADVNGRDEDADFDLLEEALGRILRVSRSTRFVDSIRARAGIKLDRASYGVLARIAAVAPVRLSDLAQELSVDASTVSRQVQALEQKGLVDRRPDPDDGRAILLELTRKGNAVQRKMQGAWQETIAAALVDWKPDDISGLATLLDRFGVDLALLEDADEV
jgi:DNA-binding MarR family transcriptional regulator